MNLSYALKTDRHDFPSAGPALSRLSTIYTRRRSPTGLGLDPGKPRRRQSIGLYVKLIRIGTVQGNLFHLRHYVCFGEPVAAGESHSNSSSVRRACEFLTSKQMDDGGWGETYMVSRGSMSIVDLISAPPRFRSLASLENTVNTSRVRSFRLLGLCCL
jgi:hypothetical protein